MCGVFAIATATPGAAPRATDPRTLAALDSLAPRGPDGRGFHRDPAGCAALGHTRLAVVELSPAGAQPMRFADEGLVIAFNGEIYNAPELRDQLRRAGAAFRSSSDTEVLLRACARWGVRSTLDRLRGMFAFALWNERTRELVAAVDHVGMKPLVYREHSSRTDRRRAHAGVSLASDLDALRTLHPDDPWTLDADALAETLCVGAIASPSTVWREAKRVPPGCLLRWSARHGSRIERWWTPPDAAEGPPLTADELGERLRVSMRRHLVADVPVAALLSAGLDSAAVVAAAADAGARELLCLTLALPNEHDESTAAAANAAALGCAHRTVRLEPHDADDLLDSVAGAFDQPQAYGALATMLAVSRAVRAHAKVVLSGDGGDEALAGYAWHAAPPERPPKGAFDAPRFDAFAATTRDRWRALADLASASTGSAYRQAVLPRFHPAEAAALLAPLGCTYDAARYARDADDLERPDLPWPRRAQRHDTLGFLADSILPKVDRASMSVGLEVRVPFLDRDLLERCLVAKPAPPGQPDGKDLLRLILQTRLPVGAAERPKQGFSLRLLTPHFWRRERERLHDGALVRDGVIDSRWPTLVADGAPYQDGRTLALVMLERWYAARHDGAARSRLPNIAHADDPAAPAAST